MLSKDVTVVCPPQGANLQGVKMLCTNAEGASLRGCNFEDPAGIKANLEGEGANQIKPALCILLILCADVCVCSSRGQSEGCGHGGKSDDGD